jgi:hypothetical protein
MTYNFFGYLINKIWLRAILHSAELKFANFKVNQLREFETEFENILGC